AHNCYRPCVRARRRREHGLLPPPLAGEGWGGGSHKGRCVCAPSLSLPRKRGRGRWGAARRNAEPEPTFALRAVCHGWRFVGTSGGEGLLLNVHWGLSAIATPL